MHILIVNDDGYRGPGLHSLIGALKSEHELTVVVPSREKSGTSNSVTFRTPLVAENVYLPQVDHDIWIVEGTPADCTALALDQFVKEKPDIVVSGINNGANVADSILYSGTVAAALQGVFQGYPTFALSCDFGCRDFSVAAEIFRDMLPGFMAKEEGCFFYNLNFPNIPRQKIQGIKKTVISHGRMIEGFEKRTNPYGQEYYWHVYDDVTEGVNGYKRVVADEGLYTDVQALREGYISITPLDLDYLDGEKLKTMADYGDLYTSLQND